MRKKKKPQITDQPEREPREVLGGSAEALEANAQGCLSEAQVATLWGEVETPQLFRLIFGGLALALAAIEDFYEANLAPHIAVFALCALPFAWRWHTIRQAIEHGIVSCVEGPVYKETTTLISSHNDRHHLDVYRLVVGSKTLQIPKPLQDQFEFGANYRLYFTPEGRYIVAAELLSASSESKRLLSQDIDKPSAKLRL